ncbi:MAG: MMPL family transporter, partial [Desulfobacterales bacterium]|nr:MMPL family transporter [Desulfobacterales bacterium]
MNRIIVWIIDHPLAAILAFLAGLALLTPRMHTLELNADMAQFLPTGDPRTAYYHDFFKDAFGSDVLSKIVVKPDDGEVFTPRTLALIQKLSDELEDMEEVSRVVSLTTVRQIRGDGDLLDTSQLITTIPEDPDELRQLGKTALRCDHFLGDILSPDGRVAAIDVYTDKPAGDRMFESRFVDRVNALMALAPDDIAVYHVGAPRAEAAFLANIARDQVTVNVAAITVIMLFLWWAYRCAAAVLSPLLTTGLSVTAT